VLQVPAVPTARLRDIDVYYEEHGSGPPLLLIPGIPAIANDWGSLAEPLSRTRHVISYDNRGSGQSSVTPGPYTTAQLAADGVALLDHLGIERADVFGMSMGGMIAQELALTRPDRVNKLVLGCTHAGIRHAVSPPRETGLAFAMDTADWAERMRALAPHAFARDVDPRMLDAFIAKKSKDVQDPAGYRAQIDAVLAHDSYERLPLLEMPTLIVTGDDDRVIPGGSSDVLRERIPGSRLEVIAGAGHLFFIERPDATIELLESFL
jgi:3-oxoadipate enol-lactonase